MGFRASQRKAENLHNGLQGPMLALSPLPSSASLGSQLLFLLSRSRLIFLEVPRMPWAHCHECWVFARPSALNVLPQPQLLSSVLHVQMFPSRLNLPSKTSYIIFGLGSKQKFRDLLFRKY